MQAGGKESGVDESRVESRVLTVWKLADETNVVYPGRGRVTT